MARPPKIYYRTDVRRNSDTDPDEQDYTGSSFIAEKNGRYGTKKNFTELLPFEHTEIKHYNLSADDKECLHFFLLHHMSGKKRFYLAPSVFSGYEV